jgi:NADH:ubiquinone oxidoreductase subunit 6 (subunit J)
MLGTAYLIFLNFEFIALSLLLLYIGGILVMFIFLILAINDYEEGSKISTPSLSTQVNIIIMVVAFLLLYFLTYLYNPLLVNLENLQFFIFLSNEYSLVDVAFIDQLYFSNTKLRVYIICDLFNFSDVFILGYVFFAEYPSYVVVLSILLLVATVAALSMLNDRFAFRAKP